MTLMVPSQTDPDVLPVWRLIYDKLLEHAEFGDIITFEDLDDALGRPFLEDRTPLYRACEYMGTMRRKWLLAVRGRGYRVIDPDEHAKVAEGHKRKGRRQFERMMRVMLVTDVSKLNHEQLATFDSQYKVNALLLNVAVAHEQRLQKIENILATEGFL